MKTGLKLAILGIVLAAQLAAPAWMIGQREWVLRNGTAYKFRTAPVDPYDAFRGRYVALSFEQNVVPFNGLGQASTLKPLYAKIEVDTDGFARLSSAGMTPPETGDYIRVDTWYPVDDKQIQLTLPFDRYYMNEKKAPLAEQAYRQHSLITTRDAYVIVRVHKGQGVIDDLFIGELPIGEFLSREAAAR